MKITKQVLGTVNGCYAVNNLVLNGAPHIVLASEAEGDSCLAWKAPDYAESHVMPGGTSTSCARFYYFNVTVDSSQAFGYPDDVSRGPTITDLTLQFTADPSKRLMHGRTFVGGLQQPVDTPYYTY